MNSNHKTPTGSIGLPDHMIFTPFGVVIVEVKMKATKDRLSERQIDLQIFLRTHNYWYYVVTTYEEAACLRNAIYRGNLEKESHEKYISPDYLKGLDD